MFAASTGQLMGAASVHIIGDSDRAAAALHPLRLRILGELGDAESAAGLARRLGIPRQLVGFILRDPGIPRHGYPVALSPDGPLISVVTSGTKSPTLGESIGLCYLPTEAAAVGKSLWVEIRQKRLRAEIVKTPFYRRK